MLHLISGDVAEYAQWVERIGSLLILAWIVRWTALKMSERLTENTKAVSSLVSAINSLTSMVQTMQSSHSLSQEETRRQTLIMVTVKDALEEVAEDIKDLRREVSK